MQSVIVDGSFEDWREKARCLLAARIEPDAIFWRDGRDGDHTSLFAGSGEIAGHPPASERITVSRTFLALARDVADHRDSNKWPLLYRTLWRLQFETPALLEIASDADVRRLETMAASVKRDAHKMTAFVRFRRIETRSEERYIAWHRPDHFVVRRTTPFFVDRFRVQNWSILTPDQCVHWDGRTASFSEGVPISEAPGPDALEELWRTYYGAIFNPARVKVAIMTREMPRRHWPTLPETELIPDLLLRADVRTEEMLARGKNATSAVDFLPPSIVSLDQLRAAAQACKGCELHCHATQTIFGEGHVGAPLMFVGEQPGDQEDLAGRPFVGPAGAVFEEVLRAAGISREQSYVTNAVKHFKFVRRGKKRLHARPHPREAAACRPWLESEIALVKPRVLVCLGATAAQSLLGTDFRMTKMRGQVIKSKWASFVIATWHPSAILRATGNAAATRMKGELICDLRIAAGLQRASSTPRSDDAQVLR